MPFTDLVKARSSDEIVKTLRQIQKKARMPNTGSEFYMDRHDRDKFLIKIKGIYVPVKK